MLVLVRCFSYTPSVGLMTRLSCTPDDTSIEVFLSVTLLMLVIVRCFSYTPHASFSEVMSFSYNPDDTL